MTMVERRWFDAGSYGFDKRSRVHDNRANGVGVF